MLSFITTLSACSIRSASSTKEIAVAPGVTVTLPAPSDLTVSASPASSVAAASIVSPLQTSVGTLASPLQVLGTPQQLHPSGPLPPGGALLSFSVVLPKSSGSTPFIASYDKSANKWIPVASQYNVGTHIVSAHVSHFSIWGVLRFVTSDLTALVHGVLDSLVGSIKITGPMPSCSGSDVSVTVRPSDGTLNFCGQDVDSTHVLVKVASTLAFPIDLNAVNGTSIALVPPADIYADINQSLYDASKGHWTGKVIPAGSEADATLPIGPGQSSTMTTDLDDVAYLTGIIYSAVQVLTLAESRLGSAAAKVATSEIGQGTCAAEISTLPSAFSLNAPNLRRLADIGFECATQVVDLGVSGVAVALIGIVASLFENVVQTAFLAVETAVGWSTGGTDQLVVSRSLSTAPPCTSASIMTAVTLYAANTPGLAGLYQPEGQPTCRGGWATLQTEEVSSTGQVLGPDQAFAQAQGGSWKVVALVDGDFCGTVPAAGLAALGYNAGCPQGSGTSPGAPPTSTTTTTSLPVLRILNSAGAVEFDGTDPGEIHFSTDQTDVVNGITWSSWTPSSAMGTGTWEYDDCMPDCGSAPMVPYPATITLSNPQNGIFTTLVEATSGPEGSSITWTYPSYWPMAACTTGSC